MTVGLLILIVLILLFGAGVVTGWLANIIGAVIGSVLLVALSVTIISLFGEDVFWLLLGGVAVLFLALHIYVDATKYTPPPRVALKVLNPAPVLPDPAVKKVWRKYADDIEHRFDVTSQARAHEIYKSRDPEALEAFCADTIANNGKTRIKPGSVIPTLRQRKQRTHD